MNLFQILDNYLLKRKVNKIMRSETKNKKQSFCGYTNESGVKLIGCKCGNSKVTSKEPDRDYGQYYCIVECNKCGYYWEGYMGFC